MSTNSSHEPTAAAEVQMGSERAFGIVFAVVFGGLALLPLLDGGGVRWWSAAVGGAFLAAALAKPDVLRPLNVVWFKFGMLLHHVVTPVVMGLLFFCTVTPVGLLMRMSGKDPMRLKKPQARSYWIDRTSGGPAPETMRNQF
ncbi:MAG: SxtJ family membrane protein [Pseudomonadota bacterium]